METVFFLGTWSGVLKNLANQSGFRMSRVSQQDADAQTRRCDSLAAPAIHRASAPDLSRLLQLDDSVTTPSELVSEITRMTEELGVVAVDYGYVKDGVRQSGWSTNPTQLRAHYFGQSLHRIDPEYNPRYRRSGVTMVPFPDGYPEDVAREPLLGGLLEEIAAAGRSGMIFVPDPDPLRRAEMGTFNIMTDLAGRSRNAWFRCEAVALGMTASALHTRMRSLRAAQQMPLSPREQQVLRGLAEGQRGSALAHRLGVSERTVEHHVRSARKRLNAKTRDHAIALALTAGWI